MKGGFNLKDRFSMGVIAGFIGTIAMDALDLLAYFLHFDRALLLDFASGLLYAHKPTFWGEYVLAELAHIFFSCSLAVIFIYLLPFIKTRRHLLKGAFFGLFSWFLIYSVAIIYKIPDLTRIPWQEATSNFLDSAVFGLLVSETIRRLYKGREEWSGQTMGDRFTKGLIAGGIAGALQVLLDFLFGAFHFGNVRFFDYTAVLIYGQRTTFWWDKIFAQIVYFGFTCFLGIIFTYLILYIGSKYYLFKGWFFATMCWFTVFAIGTMYKIQLLDKVPWPEAASNFITTSIFGLILAITLKLLSKRPAN